MGSSSANNDWHERQIIHVSRRMVVTECLPGTSKRSVCQRCAASKIWSTDQAFPRHVNYLDFCGSQTPSDCRLACVLIIPFREKRSTKKHNKMIPRSASQYAAAAKMKAIAISARMSRLYSTQANARSFLPQYTIYSPGCFLSCKVIPPSFKALRDNTIVLDNKNRGTFLIELIPRLSDGAHLIL